MAEMQYTLSGSEFRFHISCPVAIVLVYLAEEGTPPKFRLAGKSTALALTRIQIEKDGAHINFMWETRHNFRPEPRLTLEVWTVHSNDIVRVTASRRTHIACFNHRSSQAAKDSESFPDSFSIESISGEIVGPAPKRRRRSLHERWEDLRGMQRFDIA